jgi:cytidylate kinase
MILPERATDALARAHQHWSARHGHTVDTAGTNPDRFTIAISRETGTYGAAIAREIGDRLGWPVYDRELLQRIADDIGVHRKLLDSVDERQESWLSECVSRLFAVPEVNQTVYFRRLIETLLSLATHGECVIVGRGATQVLPSASTLRVRVVAPLEHRIAAVQRERSITHAKAADEVATKDRERDRFVATHFKIDPANPVHYDLVLNVARFSTKECADLILDALDRMRRRQPVERRANVLVG